MLEVIKIENFKSIRNLIFRPKRVNLIIGKPNVGKSNLLEAISLLSIPELLNKRQRLQSVRMTKLSELFYDLKQDIAVSSHRCELNLSYGSSTCIGTYNKNSIIENDIKTDFSLDENGSFPLVENYLNINLGVNLYRYKGETSFDTKVNSTSLKFPNGSNLFEVLFSRDDLIDEFQELLEDFGFKVIYLEEQERFVIQRETSKNTVRQFDFSLLADTFKRYLFYLSSIKSNEDKSILFEEPETHSFPVFISNIAQAIADDTSNQYFIVTHSPYLFDHMISEVPEDDLNVIHVDFKDKQTTIKVLKNSAVVDLNQKAIDIFFNLDNL